MESLKNIERGIVMTKYLIVDGYRGTDGWLELGEPRKLVSSLDDEYLCDCAVYELQEDGTFKKIKDMEDPVVKGFALWYIDSPHNAYNEPEYIKVIDYNFMEDAEEFVKSVDFQKWFNKIEKIIFENDQEYLGIKTIEETKNAVIKYITRDEAYGVEDGNRFWCIGEYHDDQYTFPF